MYTVFHSYKDDELIRYALSSIQHPAVQEICFRLSNLDIELAEIDELVSLKKDLDDAEKTIEELREEVEDLNNEISDLNAELEKREESHAV